MRKNTEEPMNPIRNKTPRLGKQKISNGVNKQPEQIASDLAKVVRGDVFADILHRVAYSTDASIYRIVPKCVVAPRDAGDVVTVVKYAGTKGIPVVARGAGSGLAGESLCSGIVFDMTRYMNRIIEVKDSGQTVVCEPGVVLDDLNKRLAEFGRKIGPDPSSANRAVAGGCVANNSTGAHSLEYGFIADYVENIEAVLADGSVVEFKNDFDPEQAQHEKVASIAKQCLSVLSDKEAVINKALPKSKRNRSGYNIAGICHDGRIDFARLLTGSEGTLAIFTKLTLRTVAVPAAKGLLQLEFDTLEKMAQAVPTIVDNGASTCELMDKTLINMAFEALPEYRDVLPAGAAAVLLVEHTGQTQEQVKEKIEKSDSAVGAIASGRSIFLEQKAQEQLWKSRKDAGPLLYRKRTNKHPVEFMEDVSVDYNRLGEYIAGLQEIGKHYNIMMCFYGHAGDGLLHVRPYMDLSDPADVEKMRSMANDVFSLAWSLGGTISGEHAEGLVRATFVRQQYGDEYYELLCKIKNIFDPDGLMNPGKIINPDADVMVKNLRAEYKVLPERVKTDVLFEKDELATELEQCYGCGLCRSRESDLRMCPVFRAMGEELSSSRAKANILHFWATGQLEEKDFESLEFRKFLDLCVNCKACLLQCPSGVDISELMMTARANYVKRKGLRRTEMLLSHNRYLSLLGGVFSPVSNLVTRLPVFKWLLEKFTGIDKRRGMPEFRHGSFLKAGRKYLATREPIENPVDKVAYFVDTYANYNDHELGFAVVNVLRANGIEVILPKQLPAPLPAIMYGDVKTARKDLAYNVKHLAKAVREGYKIICSEPSAALCLKSELRHFVAGTDAELVSENTYELMNYLFDLFAQKKLKPPTKSITNEFVYHSPCHLSTVGDETASIKLLSELCNVKVIDLKAGCCGLAGTFGMQKKNYELSSQISASLKEALEKSTIKNVLTECAACKMQVEHISNCTVQHPVKILAEAYRLERSEKMKKYDEKRLAASGWGKDQVTHFIKEAQHNVVISFLKSREEFNHVIEVGLLLEEAIKAVKKAETEILPIFKTFLGRSYGCYLAGVRLSASGQFTESCALFRLCIENALYAFYITRNPNLGQIWLNRDVDERSKTEVKREFKLYKMKDLLEEENPIIGRKVREYYENTIGFGAHPNINSVGLNLNVIGDWDKASLDILNTEDDVVNKAIGLNARAGLLSLSIYSLIYSEQFNETGISEKLSMLRKYHRKLASR